MVRALAITLSVLQLSLLSFVTPAIAQDDSISESLYDVLALYGEYAATSYCASSFDPGYGYTQLACASETCPTVQSAQSKIILQLNNYGSFAVNAYVAIDYTHEAIVFGIRGTDTSNPENVAADILSAPAVPLFSLCAGCYGGSGFYYSWTSVRDIVTSRILDAIAENPSFRVVATGHSLGAAIATIAAFELRNNPLIGVPVDLASYGGPRVGNSVFVRLLEDQEGINDSQNYRVTHIGDIVPNISPLLDFVQSQPNYYIASGNNAIATVGDIFVNSDPENITPEISTSQLLTNYAAVEDFTSAAHAQYIIDIEACAGVVPPPEVYKRSVAVSNTPSSSNGNKLSSAGPRPKRPVVGSLVKSYLNQVKGGKIKPHQARKAGTKGRPKGKTFKPARNLGKPDNKRKPKGTKKAPKKANTGKGSTGKSNNGSSPKSVAPPKTGSPAKNASPAKSVSPPKNAAPPKSSGPRKNPKF